MNLRLTAALLLILIGPAAMCVAADPAQTVAQSEQVLAELVAIPGKQIPAKLLAEAQGVAIVPRVIKIGFVAGGRRGHGVVLVKDAEGVWSLPRFVRLTGGSVGWQAGVQGTDVVLVFRTQRSIDNLLKGKFTIGVDAAAAAGPVGRNAAAATDASLSAEILSYSRSRGLFLGASIDGSAIEMDQVANEAFYGSPDPEMPHAIPLAATHLQAYMMELSGAAAPLAPAVLPAAAALPITASPLRIDALRRSLAMESAALFRLLSPEWQAFLALPQDAVDPASLPNAKNAAEAVARYEHVATAPEYRALASRPEFQAVQELLREYATVANAADGALQLPTPPAIGDIRR